jgi:hypothetical protein
MTAREGANAAIGTLGLLMPGVYNELRDRVEELIAAAEQAERERCAKMMDSESATYAHFLKVHPHDGERDKWWEMERRFRKLASKMREAV